MKHYTKTEIELIGFFEEDVIKTSGTEKDRDWGPLEDVFKEQEEKPI